MPVLINVNRYSKGTRNELIPVLGSQPAGDRSLEAINLAFRLPLLSARPAVTSPAAEHHRPLAGTKLYCLVTEAHVCKQLSFALGSGIRTRDLLIASPAP